MNNIKDIDLKKIAFSNESEELADKVNKYFYKRFAGKPKAANAAKQEVLATGKFDERYLDYLYQYWESMQDVQKAQLGPKAGQESAEVSED